MAAPAASTESEKRERPGKVAMMRAAVEVMGEDGYEGASIRDMAARAGVSVAALYYHFPSKLHLLGEFLEEAHEVILARLERRLLSADPTPTARLDVVVSTIVASNLHDKFARLASNVAVREHTRLEKPERKVIDEKRRRLLQLVQGVIESGVENGDFATGEPREAARAIITLCSSLVEPFPEMHRSMAEVIVLYQGFARAIAATP